MGHALPQTVALVEEVLAPYDDAHGSYVLPTTWKARPKIGRWWEWLQESGGAAVPIKHEEFERQFAAAKRRFSVRVSAGEPVVMAYLLWLLMQDVLASDPSQPQAVLALPSP